MINRILIRIKVVQMLYSYLLVQKDFHIESQPTPPTKEKRFAYDLYLNLLGLMIEISRRIEKRGGTQPLRQTRFINALEHQEIMQTLMNRWSSEPGIFQPIVTALADKVKESGLYKNFLKLSGDTMSRDTTIWRDIFNQIIVPDPAVARQARLLQNWSPGGVQRAQELMETTFTNFMSANAPIKDALKTLEHSLQKARELYFRLLRLPLDLTDLREKQLDDARHKYLPTDEDKNPNMRFVENQLVAALRHDPQLTEYCDKNKINWMAENPQMLTALLRDITASQLYRDYMELPVSDFHTDAEFWRNVFKQIIFCNDYLLEELETMSVFWNDDLEIIGTFLLKTLKRFDETLCHGTEEVDAASEPVLPMYKDEEDARFGSELMQAVITNREEYRDMIDARINSENWDSRRLAFMDVVILLTAIAELLNFPKIPTLVTVNEYIELAKSYSNPGSGGFIHGILASVIADLRAQGKLVKS